MPETRPPFPFSFLFLSSCLLWAALPGRPDDVEENYACLAGFKASVQDTQNALGSWGVASHQGAAGQRRPPCNGSISSWAGVTCDDDRVVSLQLRASGLGGVLSPDLWKCAALGALDVSANQITGEIPAVLGRLANLVALNLSANRLTGGIPAALANCSYLNSLDLHGNSLAGSIPDELGLLERLQVLDVSDNGLSGAIPGVLSYAMTGGPRFNATSFDGNKGLFGYPLSSSSSSSSSSTSSSSDGQGGGHALSLLEIAGIGLASGVFSLTVSFTAVCIWLKMAEQRRAAEEGKICELEP